MLKYPVLISSQLLPSWFTINSCYSQTLLLFLGERHTTEYSILNRSEILARCCKYWGKMLITLWPQRAKPGWTNNIDLIAEGECPASLIPLQNHVGFVAGSTEINLNGLWEERELKGILRLMMSAVIVFSMQVPNWLWEEGSIMEDPGKTEL